MWSDPTVFVNIPYAYVCIVCMSPSMIMSTHVQQYWWEGRTRVQACKYMCVCNMWSQCPVYGCPDMYSAATSYNIIFSVTQSMLLGASEIDDLTTVTVPIGTIRVIPFFFYHMIMSLYTDHHHWRDQWTIRWAGGKVSGQWLMIQCNETRDLIIACIVFMEVELPFTPICSINC